MFTYGPMTMQAPFPFFGGKRKITNEVWVRLGAPTQYIEPFCGSAAMLLAAPRIASLEVVNDMNGFIANFWRAVKHQPDKVAEAADFPVSHIDLGARHIWLMAQRERIGEAMQDPHWPGDATVAGWWLWGQCAWIGSGWCEWTRQPIEQRTENGKKPHIGTNAGVGIHALGKVPHAGNAGRGVQALGQVPHASDAGMEHLLTSSGRAAWVWLHKIARRLDRVRIVHGDWSRCVNNHYGGTDTAIFLDPPYKGYEAAYGSAQVADAVADWARDHADLRIALCGHRGDYNLPGWDVVEWSRGTFTYSGSKTTAEECIWYSPACVPRLINDLFA